MQWEWWLLGAGLVLAVVVLVIFVSKPLREILEEVRFERARREFRLQRERLEAKFIQRAAESGKPRGLRWADCDWEDQFVMARDRRTNQLSAFVGVTIRFEAVAGGPMEDVPAVGNLRNATAVFHYDRTGWGTGGRALFNLNPDEALTHYREQFEPVLPLS